MVGQIETCCGLEVCIGYKADLHAGDSEIFALPSGEAVRVEKAGGARTITRFNGDQLEEIGFEHCLNPLTVPVATHELLHLEHILVDQAVVPMRYLPGFGIDDANTGMYNVLDYIEHLFVYREMNALGVSDAASRESLRARLSTISYLPAGPCRRIVGFMGWLQVSYGFPELRSYAVARLIEADLLDDARKLERTAKASLKQDRIPLIAACLQGVGIGPHYVELSFYRRHNGKWRVGTLRLAPPPSNTAPVPDSSATR